MSRNHAQFSGAFTDDVRKAINLAIGDYSRCTTQLLVDSGSTGTTLANVTGMVTDTLEPGTYEFEIHLIVTATSNSGLKVALKQGTAGMLSSIAAKTYAVTASALATTTFTTATDAASIIGATTAYTGAVVKGTLVLGASGTFQLQAAQNASHADDTTVEVGSHMVFRKIG